MIPDDNAIAFTHTATAANTINNHTYFDHPSLNGSPLALAYVSHNWNPDGGSGVYNDQELGVWYSNSRRQWSVFNQDTGAPMPVGAAFNVLVMPSYKIFLPLIRR